VRNDSRMPPRHPSGFPASPPPRPARVTGALSEDAAAVGRRLRELREARGITLSALARRAGIGKATLSRLEAGVQNPTLETLYAVTGQLGVPLAAVLAPPAANGASIRGAAVEATLQEVFTDPTATYELYRLVIRAGASQSSPAHPAGVTEHLTVFAGELRAGPVEAPGQAGPGGYLRWAADVPHTYAAVGLEDVWASLLIRSPRS
jgi:transcriptional regulator with XRE-family HTH domain